MQSYSVFSGRSEAIVKSCSTGLSTQDAKHCFTPVACAPYHPMTSAVGQLQWKSHISPRYKQDVAGQRWGSGILISPNLFITAGHCFDSTPHGWITPIDFDGRVLSSEEFCGFMKVNFNYQKKYCGHVAGDHPELNEESFDIESVLECRRGGLDFAIIKLSGAPGLKYGYAEMALGVENEWISTFIAQHPRGLDKRVETGYAKLVPFSPMDVMHNMNTLDASSGAAIALNDPSKIEIIGIHTTGMYGVNAFNRGVSINAIRERSSIVREMLFSRYAPIPRGLVAEEPPKEKTMSSGALVAIGLGGLAIAALAFLAFSSQNKKRSQVSSDGEVPQLQSHHQMRRAG